VQVAEPGGRVHPQLVGQRAAQRGEDRERVRLPVAPVQRHHQAAGQPLKEVQVASVRADPVALRQGLDHVRPEEPAQPGHPALQRGQGMRRPADVPDQVRESLRGDHAVGRQQQPGQQRRRRAPGERHRLPVAYRLDRAEHPEPHVTHAACRPSARRYQTPDWG